MLQSGKLIFVNPELTYFVILVITAVKMCDLSRFSLGYGAGTQFAVTSSGEAGVTRSLFLLIGV
jgi:hypothetical protein